MSIEDGTVNLDFTWSPTNPEIGRTVGFQITGISGIEQATWSFGGANCDGTSQTVTCTPGFVNCMSWAYAYATSGPKYVTLTVKANGQNLAPVSHTVTVENTGSCPTGGGGGGGGGTTTCSYSISPTSRTIPASGGSGYSIAVTSTTGCSWSASENSSWLNITSGSSGTGSGTVYYTVSPNSGDQRTSWITVAGKTHAISQSAAPVPVEFTWTPHEPEKGETVTFTVSDDRITPVRW